MIIDPVADMLIRLKNASMVKKNVVDIPASNLKERILNILKREGFIQNFKHIELKPQNILRVFLLYTQEGHPYFLGAKRISRPGRRIYLAKDEVKKVYNGYGLAIITTSKGVLTDKEARELGVGGEVLCHVW
jgi:small subunit ribosomal protein S8